MCGSQNCPPTTSSQASPHYLCFILYVLVLYSSSFPSSATCTSSASASTSSPSPWPCVKRKGDKTKQADLNIPKDWDWLFPEIPSPPSVEELMKELQETKAKIKEQQVAFAKATSKKHDAEIEVAVKSALAEERKRTQDMKKRLRKELIDYHENEMKTTLEKFEEEKTKITKETMAKAQKKHELALEKQRRDLEEHFQYEKDKASEYSMSGAQLFLFRRPF